MVLIICGVPLGIMFIITAFRWEKFKRRGGHPRLQFHISDLLIGTFWMAAIGAILVTIVSPSDQTFLCSLALGSTAAGIILGKLWQLSSRTKTLENSAAYISVGVVTSLLASFIPIFGFWMLLDHFFRCC